MDCWYRKKWRLSSDNQYVCVIWVVVDEFVRILSVGHNHKCVCFSTAACLLTTSQGINIEMPRSVKAVVGSCVLVPCQTQSHTRVNWYKHQSMGWPVIYDEKKPLDVISEFRGRTSVPGHPSEGNCTLRIDNVRMSDGIALFPYINPESDKYYTPTVQIQPQCEFFHYLLKHQEKQSEWCLQKMWNKWLKSVQFQFWGKACRLCTL